MRRLFLALVAALLALAVNVSAVSAADPSVTLYTSDGGVATGGDSVACTVYLYDYNFGSGGLGTNTDGLYCTSNGWDNNVESMRFHWHSTSVCWLFYTGANYTGTAYVFHDNLGAFYELPGNQDNIFSSFRRGTQGAGSNCIPQY